jgi:hypothetical protein
MENAVYHYELVGEFTSPLRGGVPDDCKKLVEKGTKDMNDIYYKIMCAEVEACLQKGDTKGAQEIADDYTNLRIAPYNNPLNVFKQDKQNGSYPYMGAHWLFGAIRDGAKFIFPEHFYGGGVKGKPSADHFRKFVDVVPYHIFLHRPEYEKNNKNIVKKFDDVDDQQPSKKVGGFSRYEYIECPLQFYAEVLVSPRGPFLKLLEDPDNMREIIQQARNHRLGTCRSAGYGQWKIIRLTLKNGS